MYSLVFDRAIAEWVQDHIWHAPDFGDCQAIGVARDGQVVGGVVYHDYRIEDIMMSCAATDPRWLSRGRLRVFFGYPFIQLGVIRVSALTAKSNKRARKMNERLGFAMEGLVRRGMNGKDAVLYGMLRDECRWIDNGTQERPETAAAA